MSHDAHGVPLWPLPMAAGLLPAVAAGIALVLATHAGLVPSCNPFIEGCVSISRAARHDLPNHVFRALVLPAAVLQALVWLVQARALHVAGGAAMRRSAIALAALGVAAGVALVLYGSFLGTEGATYRWLRHYGTVVCFGGTCLAMLVLGRALQRLHVIGALPLPRGHERALLALFAAIVALGVVNALVGAWADAALKDRVENVTEWWGSLGLTLAFIVLASLWRRWGVGAQLSVGTGR
ncbi:MAG: hypothetical protein OEW27_01670 [Aquincola sp.]|nr:hypothetical protein [Aquincola sp.]MDH5328635.1 hypothetical protein [Aquincola sp.]